MRFCTLSVGSGAAKTLEAILLGLLDAAASLSPPPKMLLDPPPGGRNTLGEDNNNVFNDLQRGLSVIAFVNSGQISNSAPMYMLS